MALCRCWYAPQCEFGIDCTSPADWSVLQPRWGSRPERAIFMCDAHHKVYSDGSPIPGIDKPPRADDDWRPSFVDMIRLCAIRIEHERRLEREREQVVLEAAPSAHWMMREYFRRYDQRYSPEQFAQIMMLRNSVHNNP